MRHDALVRSVYDTVAEDYAARFPSTEPEQPIDLAMIDHFIAQPALQSRQILDAGCGTGRIGRYLADRGCQVWGLDLSPGMLAMAQRHRAEMDTLAGTITALPFPDESFDGCLYWYSTIHLPDSGLAAVFSEARRVLRPGGIVLVAFHSGTGERDVGASYRKLGHDVSLTRYNRTADQVARLLFAAGFAEEARLVRQPLAGERDGQAFVLARAS